MKWIGLTGGIATGKSTVARLVESLGYPVIDADQISHEITRFGQPGYVKVVDIFGSEILKENGEIDRKKLGQIIFSDINKKEVLEGILHPLIQDQVIKLKQKYQAEGAALCFYDIPLLFEKNLQSNFDYVLTVWCDTETQFKRLVARNIFAGLSKAEAEKQATIRIENQLPISKKISQSQFCIDNSGSEESLIQIVSNWLKKAQVFE